MTYVDAWYFWRKELEIDLSGFKKEEVKAEPVVEAAPVVEEENLVDDLELVAVITAAIAAASETESADGLVIRSIIRR